MEDRNGRTNVNKYRKTPGFILSCTHISFYCEIISFHMENYTENSEKSRMKERKKNERIQMLNKVSFYDFYRKTRH